MSDQQREQRIARLQAWLDELIANNAPVGERLAVIEKIEKARG